MVIVVIEQDVERASQTASALEPFGKVYQVRDEDELQAILLREGDINAFFVGVERGPDLIRSLKRKHGAPVYLVGEMPLAALNEAFVLGVEDVFPLPLDPKWVESRLKRLQTRSVSEHPVAQPPVEPWAVPEMRASSRPIPQKNRLIVVGSVKGGEGKTSFVAQLGMLLAKQGYQTLAIDADPTGNLARWLGRDVVADITQFTGRVATDPNSLESYLVKHKTGLRVLPSPLRSIEPVTWQLVEKAIQAYLPHYPVILVDLGEGYTPVLEHMAKRYATEVFVLASTDIHRMERTRQMVNTMIKQGIPLKKMRVLINKVREEGDFLPLRAGISEMDVDVWSLPWNAVLARDREEHVCPVLDDPKSEYAKEFRKLVTQTLRLKLTSVHVDTEPTKAAKKNGQTQKKTKKKAKKPWWSVFPRLAMARGGDEA